MKKLSKFLLILHNKSCILMLNLLFDFKFLLTLFQNIAILLSLSLFYEYFWLRFHSKKILQRLITGAVLSVAVSLLMFTPFKVTETIIFDTRSILLSISGLFFGFVPTLMTTITSFAIRWYIGGDGMYMGLAVIVTSPTLGLLWHYFRKNWHTHKYCWAELLALGFLVHFAMALYTMFLPSGKDIELLKLILLPLILVYIPGEVLMGILLIKQQKNWENRKAKEQLIETEFLLHQLIKESQVVAIITDNEMRITDCNPYFLNISGLKIENLLNKPIINELFKQADSQTYSKLNLLLNKTINTTSFNSRIIIESDKKLYILWHVIATENIEQQKSGFLFLGVNLTEQKLLEEKLMELNEELEYQNETYVQLNQKLEKANKKSEELLRLKNLILSNLSHEVRTPMNAILGFAELLRKDLPKDKQMQFAEIIYNSSRQLLQTIDDMVLLSKLETHDITTNPTIFNPAMLLQEIELYYQYRNRQHQIEFKLNIPSEAQHLKIFDDELKIRQILYNLINNAYHFTQKGCIELGFMLDKQHIIYFVKDTGIGIPEADQNYVFDAFYRGQQAKTFAIRGMGLGLSIVKHLVELLGGTVWFETELHKGTIFYVKLPLRITTEQSIQKPDNSVDFLKYKSILIVEDEYNNYLYLEALLKEKVHKLDYAPNGKMAIELCQKNRYDIVLMDIRMPVLNGIETTQWLKQQCPNSVIIALSAYNDTDTIQEALDAGCNTFLSKPIKEEELLEQLHRYCN